jgi:hypothetical protein
MTKMEQLLNLIIGSAHDPERAQVAEDLAREMGLDSMADLLRAQREFDAVCGPALAAIEAADRALHPEPWIGPWMFPGTLSVP